MNHWQIRLTTIALILVRGFSSGESTAAGQRSLGQFSELTLRASVPDRDFIQLEPIPLTLTASNETPRTIAGHLQVSVKRSFVHLTVVDEQGHVKEVASQVQVIADTFYAGPGAIAPGTHETETERLTIGLDDAFPAPGTYELRVTLNSLDHRFAISAPPIRIRIAAPPLDDLAAYDYIRGSAATADLFSGGRALEGEPNRLVLDELVRSYGRSRYADYANFLLGRLWSYRREYAKAVEHFAAIERKPDSPLAREAASPLAEARARLKG